MIEYVDRRGTDCAKWDDLKNTFGAEDLLPLWVADMDFAVEEHITDAIRRYVEQRVYGYYRAPASYFRSFIDWEREEHGLAVERDWIRFSPGVVPGFHYALQVLTQAGDAVMISTPVYYPFMNAIKNNGRRMITSELANDGGKYSIDFEDFERRIEENDVRVYILCSPHNPVGRVWKEDELIKVLEICRRHGVAILSDEIHHDLVYGQNRHIPTLTLAEEGDRIIMFTAASKTFNIAGLQNSFVVIRDPALREEWDSYAGGISLRAGNALGYAATEAAYRYGKPWLEEVKEIITDNYNYICESFRRTLPEAVVSPLEGTYLAWVDLGAYLTEEALRTCLQEKCRLAFDYGSWFGGDRSGSFIRINLATSGDNIREMVKRMELLQ